VARGVFEVKANREFQTRPVQGTVGPQAELWNRLRVKWAGLGIDRRGQSEFEILDTQVCSTDAFELA